ncbi:acyltransferase family protein [Micrococcus lylae]|uniref:acyltransferase family protein n=1 Tax=Micrococcus lylae TaxID=1273 RepID=UPI003CCB7E9D
MGPSDGRKAGRGSGHRRSHREGHTLTVPAPTRAAAPRDVGIDALRVAAIAAMVCDHLVLPEPLRNAIYGWHVPLFFFLSGWFYPPGRRPIQELRGRWTSVGRPYVF